MTNGTFEKATSTEKPLYGPRRLMLCGFGPDIQTNFHTALEMVGLGDTSSVWLTDDQCQFRLSELVKLDDGTGWGKESHLPRAIIISGIFEKELHNLMRVCKEADIRNALWAVLTPVSETWKLQDLLDEL